MQLLLPRLRPDQTKIALHPAKIKAVAMGRRWGKTLMAGSLSLACANAGGAVAWVVPTYKNARPVWRFAERMTAPVSNRLAVQRSERSIEFPSGGWLGVYTADNPVGILGEAFDLVIVEEAARIAPDVWAETLMPTLADRDGRALLISTPRGRNWFWQEYQRGLGDGREQASFSAPSNANPSPQIRKAFDLARARVSERTFRQEWLAEFVADGGGVFRNVEAAATAQPQPEALPEHQYVMGVDWGRTNDATVFKVLDATTREEVYSDRMTQTDYRAQTTRLKAVWEKFGQCPVLAEYNSMGGPLVEQLQNDGVSVRGFVTTNATKAEIIDALALAFERGTLRILNDPLTVGELQAYESERLPSGLVRYGAPDGMHDDSVIALALAWHGANVGNDLIAW
jgi:hypothetical protein